MFLRELIEAGTRSSQSSNAIKLDPQGRANCDNPAFAKLSVYTRDFLEGFCPTHNFSQLEKIYFRLKNMDSELAAKIRKELKAYMIAVFPIEAGVE